MPRKGTSKKTVKTCLVCGGPTSVAHLGIDLCRACAIFYRRSTKKRPTKCRASTNQCQAGKGLTCKKCRFEWIVLSLKQIPSIAPISLPLEESSAASVTDLNDDAKRDVAVENNSPEHVCPIMDRLRAQHRSMCHTRLVAEMYARGGAPHPLHLMDDSPTFPARHKSMQFGNQIMLTSALEFGNVVFPDFAALAKEDKWNILSEFFYRFRTFEGCHRANSIFPEHPYRFLPNFTTYIGPEVYADFYQDFPPSNVDISTALKYIKNSNFKIEDIAAGRAAIARLNPHNEEFLAVMGLMFWSLDGISVRPEISAIAEKYTKQIMRDLHAFYRDKMKLDDYAARLGELLMFIQLFDVKERYKEHFEMLRLLNIIDDNSFVYRLQRE